MVEKALGKVEVVRQGTLAVVMVEKLSILAMLEAEHLEILAEDMSQVVVG
jgi:hypothetical protein